MLTEKQISEIREHLERAQNPIFYYDNDCDGLCSFLILRRYLDRGKGVSIRSAPDLDAQYAKKASELNSDYVFVLDKPVINRGFFEELERLGLPVVWIDHHEIPENLSLADEFDNVSLYNPAFNEGKDKSTEPVTYLSYKIANRKEDIWLAIVGCIADHYMPDFASEFAEQFPNYWGDFEKPFDALYGSEIGAIARALNFGLKDSVSNVVKLQNYLISARGPDDVFLETTGNREFRTKYYEIKRKFDALVERAKKGISGNLVFFEYGSETGMGADLSNYLSYAYPNKYIVVARKVEGLARLSMRGNKIRDILERVLKKFDNASGGGHENAVGARVPTEDLNRFKEELEREINNE